MTKEQLEASIRFAETLFQICAVGVALFGLRAWLLTNKLKQLQAAEDLQTQTKIAQLNKDTADAQLAIEKEKTARADMGRKIGEIAAHGGQLRDNSRAGLEALLKETQDPDPTVRQAAYATLTQVGTELEQKIAGGASLHFKDHMPKMLMDIIRQHADPLATAAAFHDLKLRLGWNVSTFDFPAAERWCDQHKPKCDE